MHGNYKRWSKTEPTKKGSKTVEVTEVENGFIVCIHETEDENGKYEVEYKKYISTTNPLKDEDPTLPALDLMKEAAK
jgi:hypothetical protein